MKYLKLILEMILMLIISVCAFGGGCIIWTIIAIFLQPTPQVNEIMFYVALFVPAPFCWWLAPKLSDKWL